MGGTKDDYNFTDHYENCPGAHSVIRGADPFVNYSGKDFRIISTVGTQYPKDKGYSLASDYSIDKLDSVRGADGAWDIGAYEYAQGRDTTPPAAPSGLEIK